MPIRKLKKALRKLLPKKLSGYLAYTLPYRQSSCSQYSEDIWINKFLPQAGGFYVDIGAFHPKYGSNTYKLWKRGWNGINVDVDQYKIDLFKRFRPRDTNLSVGVSSEASERMFYYQDGGSYGSMSSFDADFANDRGEKFARKVKSRKVSVLTLDEVLERHLPRTSDGDFRTVDLISIDVEGHEHEILRVFDFDRFRPQCLCIEIHAESIGELEGTPTYKLLRDNGYNLTAWPAPSCIFTRQSEQAQLAKAS